MRDRTAAPVGDDYASRPPGRTSVWLRPALSALVLAVVLVASGTLGAGSASAAPPRASLRVVGGTSVASIASFPFQVALFIQSAGGPSAPQSTLAFCGGVIIDPTQVLTAAHCVSNDQTGQPVAPGSVTAVAGTATLPATVPVQPVASSIAIDPQYDPRTSDADLAVVTLATALYSGSPRADGKVGVAPIALVTPALAAQFANPNLSPPEPVVISGFGAATPLPVGVQAAPGSLQQQLQAAQTHLVPDATCASEYRSLGPRGIPGITPRMLCAGEPAGGIDACSGDSGGPLVVDINNPASPPGDYVLAGLIDFGAGCAQPRLPGVYVRLARPEFASFINQQAQAQGQQLIPAPAPTGPPASRNAIAHGTTSLTGSRGRVRHGAVRVRLRCVTATCTGTVILRTDTTVGIAHFAIPADSTLSVPVRITRRGRRELARHRQGLRTRATLRTTGSANTHRTFTITG